MTSDLERIQKIINAVKKHDCLWNVNASDYGKRDKLEKAWKDVAQEVGKSEIFCRDKWRNVRTGFLRSIQHQLRRPSPEDENNLDTVKRKSFYLYDQMAFFLPAAEALEQKRKKRKLSKDHKTTEIGNDTDGDDSLMTAYNLVGKFEMNDEVDNDDDKSDHENEEHHNFIINCDEYDNRDDCNIEELLKRIEIKQNKKKKYLNKQQHKISIPIEDKVNEDLNTDSLSLKNKQLNQLIQKENNIVFLKSNENLESCPKSLGEKSSKNEGQFSERDEQQLLHFFRSCTDDILALSKRKQRLFKKRLLDLIDELQDS